MHWKYKAKLQNWIDMLPAPVSYKLYYFIQRRIGRLKNFNVLPILEGALECVRYIKKMKLDPVGKVYFEVGTGRVPIAPIVFWLIGAKKTITVDLNPYIKEELFFDFVQYIAENETRIRRLFGEILIKERFNELLRRARETNMSLQKYLELCEIDYVSPGDATSINLECDSVDFHYSFTVYEHIPYHVLVDILKEGNRIVRKGGLFINAIDYFDHFMHFDESISSINFLQYSDSEWEKYAGNRYMYMNRLRHDDFLGLFESCGHKIIVEDIKLDEHAVKLIERGELILDQKFANKKAEVNCIQSSWIVTKFDN